MSAKQRKEIVRRFYDQISEGNLDVAQEVIAPDFVMHGATPGLPNGPEGTRAAFQTYLAAFPDLSIDVDDLVAEGDKVAARLQMGGTHEGPFLGIEPTGEKVTISGMVIYRFEDDQAVEGWSNRDDLSLLQQLGAAPTPQQGLK